MRACLQQLLRQHVIAVFIVFLLLTALVASAPIIAFFDLSVIDAAVAASMAVAVGILARAITPEEAGHLSRLLRPFAVGLALPAIWMMVQIVPTPPGSRFSHPIWASTQAAIAVPLDGSISVDPGLTLLALARYAALAAVFLAATAASIDRRRAEWILRALTCVTTVMAIMVILQATTSLAFVEKSGVRAAIFLQGGASLGVIVAAAGMIRAFERRESRQIKGEAPFGQFARDFGANGIALLICGLALVLSGAGQEIFATSCGLLMMGLVVITRRFALGLVSSTALGTLTILTLLAVAVRPSEQGDLTLRFANAPASLVADVDRLIGDTGWGGSGAGSYAALMPIYRNIDEPTDEPAPTSAAQISIEMGPVALWGIVVMMLSFAGYLLRGAVRRGRDSFYSAAAMSAAVVLTLDAFCDASALSTAIGLIGATILGLGLAQSVSRGARQQSTKPSRQTFPAMGPS